MGQWNDSDAVWWSNVYFDRLGIIQRDSSSVTLTSIFLTISCKIPFKIIQIINKNHHFSFFYNLKEIKYNFLLTVGYALRPSQQPTNLFQIYQNKHWTIKQWDDCFIDPSSHHVLVSIFSVHEKLLHSPKSILSNREIFSWHK